MQKTDLTEFFDQEYGKLVNELNTYLENSKNSKWYDYFLYNADYKNNYTLYKALGRLDILMKLSRYIGEEI
jgi:hypothetical protein